MQVLIHLNDTDIKALIISIKLASYLLYSCVQLSFGVVVGRSQIGSNKLPELLLLQLTIPIAVQIVKPALHMPWLLLPWSRATWTRCQQYEQHSNKSAAPEAP